MAQSPVFGVSGDAAQVRIGGLKRVAFLLVLFSLALPAHATARARSTAAIVAGLLCIHDGMLHRYIGHGDPYRIRNYQTVGDVPGWGEGSWTDHGPVDWGGLQMDVGFQRTYGPEFHGTADTWPTWVQLRVAARAVRGYHGYHGRGFAPWPHTRVPCGL